MQWGAEGVRMNFLRLGIGAFLDLGLNDDFPSFDPLLNIVLDDCIEHLRDPDDPFRLGHLQLFHPFLSS